MKIHLTTFNLQGIELPEKTTDIRKITHIIETWIRTDPYQKLQQKSKGQSSGDFEPDIFVAALQEMVPLNVKGFLENSEQAAANWSGVFLEILNKKANDGGPVYLAMEPLTMFGIALFVFVRREIAPVITHYDRDNVRAGGWGPVAIGEKGGVAIRMDVGTSSLCFVGAHLAAGEGNLKQRIDDWMKIRNDLSFENDMRLEDHEYVFWLGDMNSRLVINSAADSEKVQNALKTADWPRLVAGHDELTLVRTKATGNKDLSMFAGYKEGLVTFPPTYKYKPGTQQFVEETPAFTDRILWRKTGPEPESNEKHGHLLFYDSTQSVTLSDHRPVTALLNIKVQLPTPLNPSPTHIPRPQLVKPAPARPPPDQPIPVYATPAVEPPKKPASQPTEANTPKLLYNISVEASSYAGQGASYPAPSSAVYQPKSVPYPQPSYPRNPYSTNEMIYELRQINTGQYDTSAAVPVSNGSNNLGGPQAETVSQEDYADILRTIERVRKSKEYRKLDSDTSSESSSDSDSGSSDGLPRQRIRKREPMKAPRRRSGQPVSSRKSAPPRRTRNRKAGKPPRFESDFYPGSVRREPLYGADLHTPETVQPAVLAAQVEPGTLYELYPAPEYNLPAPDVHYVAIPYDA